MTLPPAAPPKSICLLRLSALGDISHALPVVRTLQRHWPETAITWVIGKFEHGLVYDIPGIEFLTFDKAEGMGAYRRLRRQMRARRFDILLHMQMSMRANLASVFVPADIRLGFDRRRAKDLQWLFTNHRIGHRPRQHVVESFLGFTEALGIEEHVLEWDIPVPHAAREFARSVLPADRRVLVISPCSSMAYRNWRASGYAEVGDYASREWDMQVVLCGGPSTIEREYADEIVSTMRAPVTDLIGKTDLKQLLAVLERAAIVVAPDSGPAHLASAVGTPVIGLYAATNPDRARPYLSPELVVNRYPEAIAAQYGKPVSAVPWGTRARSAASMNMIGSDEVIAVLRDHLQHRRALFRKRGE